MTVNDAVLKRQENIMNQMGLNKNSLSHKAGVPSTTIYSHRRPTRKGQNISIRTIRLICDGMKISLRDFFDDPMFFNMDEEPDRQEEPTAPKKPKGPEKPKALEEPKND